MGASQELDVFYLIFAGTVTIFILVTSIVVFFYLYQRKLYRKEQEMSTMQIQHQEELLFANWEVIEEERKRLSKEFHDDIGSIFSTLSLMLGTLREQPGGADGKVLQQSQQLIDTGIKNMRRILYDIVPPDIEIFGLNNTIVTLCERINSTQQILVVFQEKGTGFPQLDKQQELTLYRIVQELINNTIKHAGADRADLELTSTPEMLSLHYQDNGKGFDIGLLKKRGLGLRNIESRAKMISADIEFAPSEGNGMSFSLKLNTQKTNE